MAFVEIGLEMLERGALADAFSGGASAVVIIAKDFVRKLWDRLMNDPDERLPWESPLETIAENHHGSGDITEGLGDVVYYRPGMHGHIARKFEILQKDGHLETWPPCFRQDGQALCPAPDLVEDCWALTHRIVEALVPPDRLLPSCRVAVQRLKYQRDNAALEDMAALVAHSLGRWGQIGFAIDAAKARATGPLAKRGIADLFGIFSQFGPVSGAMQKVNGALVRRSTVPRLAHDQHLIERPHLDTRYFSAICGSRDTIRTQIYRDGNWIDLPITPDTLVVIPGRLAFSQLGIPAALHRVIHVEGPGFARNTAHAGDARNHNTTLLLGAK